MAYMVYVFGYLHFALFSVIFKPLRGFHFVGISVCICDLQVGVTICSFKNHTHTRSIISVCFWILLVTKRKSDVGEYTS